MKKLDDAQWIGIKPVLDEEFHPLRGAQWVGPKKAEPTDNTLMVVSGTFSLPENKTVKSAVLHWWMEGRSYFDFETKRAAEADQAVWSSIKVNGTGKGLAGANSLNAALMPKEAELTAVLRSGVNRIDLLSWMHLSRPAVIARVVVQYEDGTQDTFTTDTSWTCRMITYEQAQQPEWHTMEADEQSCVEYGAFEDDIWPADDVRSWLHAVQQPVELCRTFTLPDRPIATARMYSTAVGAYESQFNGRKAGVDHMAPGWTDYRKTIYVQCYEVSSLLKPGENQWTATVADGWAGSNMNGCQYAWPRHKPYCAVLEVRYADGETLTFPTRPEDWRGRCGALRYSNVYHGEDLDCTCEGAWRPAIALHAGPADVVPEVDHAPRACREMPPVEILSRGNKKWMVDFGQNFSGVVRLHLNEPRGTKVVIRHGEMLRKDGELMVSMNRTARCTDSVVCPGGAFVFQPRFTYRGFRYAEITGMTSEPEPDDVRGVVITNALDQTLELSFADTRLNQLTEAIRWTQMSNWFSVPTDCPQRGERLGWMGDSQVFASSGALFYDSRDFFRKHVDDMFDAANRNGALPDFAPCGGGAGPVATYAWADAGVIFPYVIWKTYGDLECVRKHWDGIRKYLRHRDESADAEGLNIHGGYGDWLTLRPKTPHEIMGPVLHARAHKLAAELAEGLGDGQAAEHHGKRHAEISAVWRQRHVRDDGAIESDTQAVYLAAWQAGMLTDEVKERIKPALRETFAREDDHLVAGLIGTAAAMDALVEAGLEDVAWKILTRDEFPSFGYFFKHGMTTIPEWWDPFPEKRVVEYWGNENDSWCDYEQGEVKASLNHFFFGSVFEGMVKYVLGLRRAEDDAGFRRAVIEPRLIDFLSSASGTFRSVHGVWRVAWKREGDGLSFEITVPPECEARVVYPSTFSREDVLLKAGHHTL